MRSWNRNFRLLAVAVGAQGIFFGVLMSLFYNFVVERLGIEPHELGGLEALREVPGFLNVLFLAAMIRFAPPIVGAVSMGIMGLGIMAYAAADSVVWLAIYSLVESIGFHCWIPLEQAMALAFSPEGNKGRWLGQLRSVNSFAWLATIGICNLVFTYLGYEGLFVMSGVATILGGIAVFFADKKKPEAQKGFVLRRRYKLYYMLNFLQGLRKQVFITFAIYALVKVHGMPIETTLKLVFVNQLLITVTATWMGKLVDHYGERIMLSLSYAGLAIVFFGYATIHHRPTLYVLYCIDNLIFFGGIALTTYLHKIAPEEDLKPTLSMGVTMNHMAAVAAPLVGGFAWRLFGYEVIFLAGSALAVLSLIVSQWVDPEGLLEREKLGGAPRQLAIQPAD
ncbi:MFS transporter [bacterium]|nr:MFS transporter [bacterium]